MPDRPVKFSTISLLALVLVLLPAVQQARAQALDSAVIETPATAPAGEPAAAATTGATTSALQGGGGLPQRRPQPRTLVAFWPVFAGFSLVWLGLVGYLLTFNGRLKRVADGLAQITNAGRKGGA